MTGRVVSIEGWKTATFVSLYFSTVGKSSTQCCDFKICPCALHSEKCC